MKLDKDQPYGVISGVHNASFEQDGVLFDIEGNVVQAEEEAKKRGRKAKMEEAIEDEAVTEEVVSEKVDDPI